eukprot:3294143-Pleurochrysis_carterae.AAC.2
MSSALGLLASTYDDDDEQPAAPAAGSANTSIVVNAAPLELEERNAGAAPLANLKPDKRTGELSVEFNPGYEQMWAPEQGPSLEPAEQRAAGIKTKAHFLGHAQPFNPANDFAFEEQYHTFNAYGFAENPSTGGASGQAADYGPAMSANPGIVGDADKWAEARGGRYCLVFR